MERYATIIISYRRPDLLAAVLTRLAAQSHRPSVIVVVDNGGDLPDQILDEAALADRVVLVRRPDNPGYSAAVNEARAVVRERGLNRVLVLTHDAEFGPDLAASLDHALETDGRGAAAPLLRWASARERTFSAGGRLGRTGRAWNLVEPTSPDRPYEVDWVDGAIVMYRVDALDAIEWLDERYFLYFEDVDTAWRMRRAGWSTVVSPATLAMQQPGAHPMYLGIRNMTLFARTAGIPGPLQVAGVIRRVAEEAVYRVLHGRAPGLIDAWRGWRDGRKGRSGPPEVAHA